MRQTVETIAGDVSGISYTFPVFRFEGSASGAPSVYIQAALHGGELPGVAAIHHLMPLLRAANDEGRILGPITIVPWANPIGRAQHLFGDQQGRFALDSRTNFNRDFPLLPKPDARIPDDPSNRADQRLKARLLALSMGNDIVLDLHCDDEGVPYLYVPKMLWPGMADVAEAMDMAAVILWDGGSGASFDDASIHPYRDAPPKIAAKDRRVVATVEYRGVADVSPDLASRDARGLYNALATRGVIEDRRAGERGAFSGLAAPIEYVEIVRTPVSGVVLYHVAPGDLVAAGARLATIIHAPGEADGSLDILAPQAGYVLTRRDRRFLRTGDDVLKLVGEHPSVTAKSGALED